MALYEQRLDRALHAAMRQFAHLQKMQREAERDEPEEPASDHRRERVSAVQNEATADTEELQNRAKSVEGSENEPSSVAQNEPTDGIDAQALTSTHPHPDPMEQAPSAFEGSRSHHFDNSPGGS